MDEQQPPLQQEPSHRGLFIIIIVLAVIIAVGVGAYFYIQNTNSENDNQNAATNTIQPVSNTLPTQNTNTSTTTNIPSNTNTYGVEEGESRVLTNEEKVADNINPELNVTVENQGGEEVMIFTR